MACLGIRRALVLPLLVVLALVQTACGTEESGAPIELKILHINDHHSRLDPETITLRLMNANGAREAVTVDLGGFARVKQAIDELAGSNPNVLKLHAGDAITGDLYFTLDEGRSDAALMNTVCFDAFVLGNHEFDNGDAGLRKFIDFLHAGGPCRTPVLSANTRPGVGSPLGALGQLIQPSVVLTRGGERIGIVGITVSDKTARSSRPSAGTTFENEIAAAQREIDRLREQGVNKIILLTHVGFSADRALVRELSGVDVIVGGDSHTLLGPATLADYGLTPGGEYPTRATDKDGNPVCIVQAWQYAFAVGELNVKFDAGGRVTECSGTTHILVGDTPRRGATPVTGADLTAMRNDMAASRVLRPTALSNSANAVLAPFKAAKDAFGNVKVGVAAENLCLRRVPGTKRDINRSTLGDVCNRDPRVIAHGGDAQQLVAQVFLERGRQFGGADIALQNGGGVRTDIPAGDITVGRIYTMLPFKNTLVRLTMTGAEIKAALEDGIAFMLAGAGNTGAYPYTANLRFKVDLNQPAGQRVRDLQFRNAQGQWVAFDLSATYRLITNNFLADGGDGYATLKAIPASRREDTFLDYAEPFLDYVRSRGTIARLPVAEYSTQDFIDTP
ncbi:MAG: 5'-nucleotidase C-terminal domain-containing protein [Casimicrobiaceae bacterium]|nr:5'-nucleotidase C-terminal domain-containing protein [Casimicrobiaceae bacterium]MDW8312461.1 5'-nucleotidase C-terminal domain-containing protein [Burkholderiales bacterium]